MLKFLKKGLSMGVSTWQILVILLVILLLFGGKKIPELAKGLGQGIKNFKDAVKEGEEADIKTTEKVENKTANKETEKKEINA